MNEVERIKEEYPEVLLMDGYDDCVVGICHRFGQEPIVAYSRSKVLKKLQMEAVKNIDDGLSEDEAVEFFEFNMIGAWVGDQTPCFIEEVGNE